MRGTCVRVGMRGKASRVFLPRGLPGAASLTSLWLQILLNNPSFPGPSSL